MREAGQESAFFGDLVVLFYEARTNRLRGELFWSHSCKHMIDEDAWRLAPRNSEKQATAVPAIKEQNAWLFAHSSSF